MGWHARSPGEEDGGVNGELILWSDGLLSKWGFNDGDEPDSWLDWCDEQGLPYASRWHPVLRQLVRERLLPMLAANHDITVYDIDTNHNPIRAETFDGHEVHDADSHWEPPFELKPDHVTVTFADVARVVAEIDGWSSELRAKVKAA